MVNPTNPINPNGIIMLSTVKFKSAFFIFNFYLRGTFGTFGTLIIENANNANNANLF